MSTIFLVISSVVVGAAQLGAGLHALREGDLRHLRHELGDAVDHAVGDPHHAARVLDRRLRLHLAEGDDLGHVAAAVLLGDVVDHALAAGHCEVDVDVGHGLSARVQEALEEQRVADRVEIGDVQAVGDERPGGRPAARPDRDAVGAGEADEVPHDQEVVGEAHLLDRLQLELEPAAQLGRLGAVALAQPCLGQLAQVRDGGLAVGHVELGQVQRVEVDVGVAALGDLGRAPQHVLAPRPRHEVVHLLLALQVEAVVREPEPVGVVERVVRLDAQQRLVRDRVGRGEVVDVARADERQAGVAGQGREARVDARLDVDAAVLQLDVDLVLAEDVDERVELAAREPLVALHERLADAPGQAARERDDAVGVGGELGQVDAGPVPVAVEVRGRDQAHEVVIARRRLGEQRQVRAALLLHPARVVVDDVHLAAQDRLDPGLCRRPRQLDDPGHRAVVGEADGGHAHLGGPGHERADPACPVEDRVLAVDVEVDVRRGLGHGVASVPSGGDGAGSGRVHRKEHPNAPSAIPRFGESSGAGPLPIMRP